MMMEGYADENDRLAERITFRSYFKRGGFYMMKRRLLLRLWFMISIENRNL